jgi:hypothetical protein
MGAPRTRVWLPGVVVMDELSNEQEMFDSKVSTLRRIRFRCDHVIGDRQFVCPLSQSFIAILE